MGFVRVCSLSSRYGDMGHGLGTLCLSDRLVFLSSWYGDAVPLSVWSFCVPCLQGMETQCLCLSSRFVFSVFRIWRHGACAADHFVFPVFRVWRQSARVSLVVLCSLSSGYGDSACVSLIVLYFLSSGNGDMGHCVGTWSVLSLYVPRCLQGISTYSTMLVPCLFH